MEKFDFPSVLQGRFVSVCPAQPQGSLQPEFWGAAQPGLVFGQQMST